MKEKNLICLLENDVGGGGGWGTLLGEAFPMSIFLWNLVNRIYCVSSLKFRIPDQDGFEHIWLL